MSASSSTLAPSPRPLGRVGWAWLLAFLIAAVLVRLAAAALLPTIERPDEIFQNLEPAHRLWTGYGIMSWEWRVGLRSWLFPGFLYGLMSLAGVLHLPADAVLPLIWAVLAIAASGTVVAGVLMGWHRFGTTGAVLCGILTAFWPDMVYYGPKTLVEVQAGNLIVVAAALASVRAPFASVTRLVAIGILLGLSFDLRFQLAVPLLLVACWAARLEFRRAWVPLIVGAALPILLLGTTDWWTLGTPFQSVWKNVTVNLIQGKAQEFGVEPFYKYLSYVVVRNGAASVLIAALFVYGASLAPLLALTALSVVAFHSLIAHKEVSFIYAALPCAMIVAGLGAARFVENLQRWLAHPPSRPLLTGATAIFLLATIVAVDIAEKPFTQLPVQTANLSSFFRTMHASPDLCGVALISDNERLWSNTGGYSLLGRNVPIYLLTTPQALTDNNKSFNYAVVAKNKLPLMTDFKLVECKDELCLLTQQVECQPTTAHEISAELLSTAQ